MTKRLILITIFICSTIQFVSSQSVSSKRNDITKYTVPSGDLYDIVMNATIRIADTGKWGKINRTSAPPRVASGGSTPTPTPALFRKQNVKYNSKLKSLGITSGAKIAAFRVFLIRNEKYGIPSKDVTFAGFTYKLRIAPQDLMKVTEDSTVSNVVEILENNVGIWRLPTQRALELVSECNARMNATAGSSAATQYPVNELVSNVHSSQNDVDAFLECLTRYHGNGQFSSSIQGFINARAIGNDGNTRAYKLVDNRLLRSLQSRAKIALKKMCKHSIRER